jgi:holo-[acyl-carrier protein] synthase
MIVGIGIDLAEVERYRFTPEKLERFARKIYTDEELRYALRKRNSSQSLAGFFAAKEAARKAFGMAIPWRQIGVTHLPGGAPRLTLSGVAADMALQRGVIAAHLTITHTERTAAAVVVLES